MNLFIALTIVFIFAAAAIVVVSVIFRLARKELGQSTGRQPTTAANTDFIGTKKLLSDSEAAFYWTLKKANADKYIVALKVPLNDFLKPPYLDKNLYSMLQNGHVDFLLLHSRSCEPIAGIELDDSTHQTPAGRDRGNRKDTLFTRAKLPLRRFRVGENWNVESIQAWIHSLGKGEDANQQLTK